MVTSDSFICAITGSNGYVGTCVKNHFAACGWKILELKRRVKNEAQAISYELGKDFQELALRQATSFVHCAYDFKPVRWDEIARVNVQGSRKILECARQAGVKKIICISSISAYDGCRSLYGKAKLEIEKIALDNGALIIRPGLVYGNGQGGMFGKLVAQLRNSSFIPMIGSGSQVQFLVHNKDLSGFIEKYSAGKNEITPQIITAANERPWPFKELLLEIARALNRKPKFIPLPWRAVWLGLKSTEFCRWNLNFRSDSLVSLIYQNPKPDFSTNAELGLVCRPFKAEELEL